MDGGVQAAPIGFCGQALKFAKTGLYPSNRLLVSSGAERESAAKSSGCEGDKFSFFLEVDGRIRSEY